MPGWPSVVDAGRWTKTNRLSILRERHDGDGVAALGGVAAAKAADVGGSGEVIAERLLQRASAVSMKDDGIGRALSVSIAVGAGGSERFHDGR